MKHIRYIIFSLLMIMLVSCVGYNPSITEAKKIDRDSFGICHAGNKGSDEKELLSSLGVSIVRLDISWEYVQPTPGDFDFSRYDAMVKRTQEAGVGLLAVLGFDTPWLHENPEGLRQINPEDLPKWLAFVEAVVTRYANDVVAFEIWNEPNYKTFWTGKKEDFFTLTKETVQTIHRVAPGVKVLVGSIILHPIRAGRSYLKKFLASGAADDADGIAVHAYGMSAYEAGRRITDAQKAMDKHGFQGELWVTETGLPTGGGYPYKVSPERQGAFTAKWILLEYAAGADRVIWYQLYDQFRPEDAPKTATSEDFFGIAYEDFEMKTGGKLMQYLMPRLLGSQWAPEMESRKPIRGPFKNMFILKTQDSTVMVVAWSNMFKRKVTISGFPQGASLYDSRTNEERPWQPGEVITLSADPVIITGISSGDITLIKQ